MRDDDIRRSRTHGHGCSHIIVGIGGIVIIEHHHVLVGVCVDGLGSGLSGLLINDLTGSPPVLSEYVCKLFYVETHTSG